VTDDLRMRILAAAASTPSATRGERRSWMTAGYALAGLACLGVYQLEGGVAHVAGRPAGVTLALVGGAVLLAAAALAAGTWRGRSTAGRPWVVLAATATLVPVLTLGWMGLFRGRYVEPFERFGWRCMGITFACGIAVGAVAFLARRRSVAVSPRWHGAALAAGAAAVGGVVVDAWCPLTNAPHVMVGHVLPMAVLALAGAAIGRAVLAVRA
jgi:hypothetical protein